MYTQLETSTLSNSTADVSTLFILSSEHHIGLLIGFEEEKERRFLTLNKTFNSARPKKALCTEITEFQVLSLKKSFDHTDPVITRLTIGKLKPIVFGMAQ